MRTRLILPSTSRFLALPLLAAACACGPWGAAPGPQESPPAVVVAPVLQKTVPVFNEYVARTDASETVDLVARVEGILVGRSFEEGKAVQEGQVLYRIDPARYEANLLSAKAKVAQAEAQLVKAAQDVARYRPLAAAHAIPQQELDSALATQAIAEADVQAAKAARVQAELDLSYCTIKAPLTGIIGRNMVSVGNLVGRGAATVLATMSRMDPMDATFGVPEAGWLYARKIQGRGVGMTVQMVLADNTLYEHPGRIRFADRAVDVRTGTLQVQVRFPNPGAVIRPNQFARVRVQVALAEDALLIPQKAVLEQQGSKAVYVVGPDNVVAQRTVVLGPAVENQFIVKDGIKAGERVIVEGQQKAHPGAAVAPAAQAATAEP